MPLVENVHRRNQTSLGKLTPSADQRKFVSGWGVVEGTPPSGWHGVGDMMDGIPISSDGAKLLQFTEHRVNGKTRDIKYMGMTLREMVADRRDVNEANKYCGFISEQRVQKEEQNVQNRELGQQLTKTIQSGYEAAPVADFSNAFQNPDQFQPAEPKRKGWPKGKKRGPRVSAETQPQPT
jgi:hypothetical protein